MKRVHFGELKEQQKKTAKQVSVDELDLASVHYVAGFDITFIGEKAIVGAAVLDVETNNIVEKRHLVVDTPMQYVPGFIAFREGPPIMQLYFDLEYEPDVILVDGHGILHPEKAGLASYIGVELAKPTIGIAKTHGDAEERGEELIMNGEVRGIKVKTKEHARELIVSPGHLITTKQAAELVQKLVIPPHKQPEPLHVARRIAKKAAQELRS